MKNKGYVDLPLVAPMYGTYHFQLPGSAIIGSNPSIRNWYLNEIIILSCTRRFLKGFNSPEVCVAASAWDNNPYIDVVTYPLEYLNGSVNSIIRNLLDDGRYVYYCGVDDYYIEGKTWYKIKHFDHDGLICGYNQNNKTYCIYAYDQNWLCKKFWTSQKGFNKGQKYMANQGVYGRICGLKVKKENMEFSPNSALRLIAEYLDSNLERYPITEQGDVWGIVVHDYVAMYIDKLYDGSVTHEKMDHRIFKAIWEHKVVMLERIQNIEKDLNLNSDISDKYKKVVNETNRLRMLYAAHHQKQRTSILPSIKKNLLIVKNEEMKILKALLHITGWNSK